MASFLQTHLPEKGKEGVIDQMKVQMVWLDHPGKKVKPLPGPGPPRKKLSSREKKRLGLYAIPKEKQRSESAITSLCNLPPVDGSVTLSKVCSVSSTS